MRLARTAILAVLLALATPVAVSADKLVDPGVATFKTVQPNSATQYGEELVAFGGFIYFAADDGVHGNELWRTDGTAAGTTLVADVYPGGADTHSNPHALTIAGDRLFFNARPSLSSSSETVFFINASAPTTVVTAKALTAPNSGAAGTPVEANGSLFGSVNGKALIGRLQGENQNANYAVYVLGDTGDTFTKISNGLEDVGVTNVFSPAATAGGWTYYNRRNVNVSPGQGGELWRTNGTITEMVKDINPGTAGSTPVGFVATSNHVYFQANDGTNGYELWVTNPANPADTHMIDKHHPGSVGTNITDPGAVANGDVLYYVPSDDPVTGSEVWRTDGTDAGTRVVKDIIPGPGGQSGPDLFPFKTGVGILYGSRIFASDGTAAGTTELGEAGGDGYGPNSPIVLGAQAYFTGGYSPFGQAVWRTDGTPAGTGGLTAAGYEGKPSGSVSAGPYAVLGTKLLFFAADPAVPDGRKLYVLDTAQADDVRKNTSLPTVAGTPTDGQTLTGSKGTWTRDADSKYTYEWLRNSTPIPNATGTTYTVSSADAGAQIRFRVTATGIGFPNVVTAVSGVAGAPTSTPTPGATTKLTVSKKPKLSGKAKVGKTLKLTPPKFSQSGVKLAYSWFANGKRIKKQSKSSLKLKKAQKGKKITAKVKATKTGFTSVTLTVGPTKKVKAA